jgi:hypothetical protein
MKIKQNKIIKRVFSALTMVPLVGKILVAGKKRFYQNNPMFYKANFDGLATNANLSFLDDKLFNKCYQQSVFNGGRDYRFYLRVHQALWCAQVASNIEGNYVELGTGRGFIFGAVAKYIEIKKINKKIVLFDTFLPYKTDPINGNQINGTKKSEFYASCYEDVREKFAEFKFVELVSGLCPESIVEYYSRNWNQKISFLHVDLNFFQAEISSLKVLWPYIQNGACILLDDYANNGRESQNKAFNDFFSEFGIPVLTTASGQGIVIKPPFLPEG